MFRSTLSFPDVKISQLADKKKGISPFSNSVTSQSHTHQTRYQRKSGFLEVDLSGRVDEAYNWKALQAWFFVRISHLSRTKSHISRDAYKNSPLGIHLRVRISSVHVTAPWCPRMRSFIRLNTPGRRLGHTFSLETSVFSLISSFRFPPIICLIINDLTAGLCPKTDIDPGVTK